ncbi:hypothetical protein LTR85_009427 [Meristemomyces frigidus]|nr:hypothetical protein LTR85_009427 [Meristemomyces frigidus]
MTNLLPPNLLALFQPRPALRYLPPADHPPEDRRTAAITGIAAFLPALRDEPEIPYHPTESWLEARDRRILEKQAHQKYIASDGFNELYKPTEDQNIRGDAFKTLFVARLPYDADIKDLEREFGRFGPIERIRIVTDNGASEKVGQQEEVKLDGEQNGDGVKKAKQPPTKKSRKGQSRGYAFVVFEREKDMKAAYKETDHLTIRGRRVLVDVERGRTVSGWRPRRFGGGLGGRNYTKAAPPKPAGFGPPAGPGGFRGGFRGGFGDRGGFSDRGGGFGDRGGGFRGRGGGFRGDRGGYGGDRGGYGGDRGGYGGGRGGIGYGAPDGAPAGPRGGGFGGGYGGGRGGGGGYGGGGGGYEDRGGSRNANLEPLPPRGGDPRGADSRGGDPRGGGGGYRDRDAGGYSGQGQKRPYDGGGYDESRSRRRY